MHSATLQELARLRMAEDQRQSARRELGYMAVKLQSQTQPGEALPVTSRLSNGVRVFRVLLRRTAPAA